MIELNKLTNENLVKCINEIGTEFRDYNFCIGEIEYQLEELYYNSMFYDNKYRFTFKSVYNDKITYTIQMIELPFNTIEFCEAWTDWIEYKQEEFNFKYKSKHSLKAALNKINRISNGNEAIAILIIEESMANGWKGLFSIKEDKKEKQSAWDIIQKVKQGTYDQ